MPWTPEGLSGSVLAIWLMQIQGGASKLERGHLSAELLSPIFMPYTPPICRRLALIPILSFHGQLPTSCHWLWLGAPVVHACGYQSFMPEAPLHMLPLTYQWPTPSIDSTRVLSAGTLQRIGVLVTLLVSAPPFSTMFCLFPLNFLIHHTISLFIFIIFRLSRNLSCCTILHFIYV